VKSLRRGIVANLAMVNAGSMARCDCAGDSRRTESKATGLPLAAPIESGDARQAMSVPGTRLPTWALRQVGSYWGTPAVALTHSARQRV